MTIKTKIVKTKEGYWWKVYHKVETKTNADKKVSNCIIGAKNKK